MLLSPSEGFLWQLFLILVFSATFGLICGLRLLISILLNVVYTSVPSSVTQNASVPAKLLYLGM